MKRALELALKGEGRTSPNPLVGAVIVKDGIIVGEGYHKQAGGPHAEIMALEQAGIKARGANLYVTLEPCNHYGKTPPCTEAIIRGGLKNVYIATLDPNPLVSGKGLNRLKQAGINVYTGLLEKEAQKANEIFLKYIQSKMPFVAIKSACSLDGKIATYQGESQWITSEKSRNFGHKLRNIYDAIMVGIGTAKTDNPRLNCRIPGGRDPLRIIVDSKLSISPEARVFTNPSSAKTIIATTTQADSARFKEFKDKGEILVVNEGEQVDLNKLFKLLASRGISSILVEGGGALAGSLLQNELVDKLYLFLAPLLIGGKEAPGLIGGKGFPYLKDTAKLKNLEFQRIAEDLLITAYISK